LSWQDDLVLLFNLRKDTPLAKTFFILAILQNVHGPKTSNYQGDRQTVKRFDLNSIKGSAQSSKHWFAYTNAGKKAGQRIAL
jgi:hypothetical protein